VGGADGQFMIGRNYRTFFRASLSDHRDAEGVDRSGHSYDVGFRREGRSVGYSLITNGVSPDFRTDTGFVRRVNQRQTIGSVNYRWWPEHWITNWGPQFNYERIYGYDGVLQDEVAGVGLNAMFARGVFAFGNVNRDMERFGGIDFRKTRYGLGAFVNSSRRFGFGAFYNSGDQIRYVTDPFLGYGHNWTGFINVRPFTRLQSDINIITSDLTDPQTNTELFDVKIFRARTTYQFTDRFLFRNILEYNTFDKTVGGNFLLTYRINAGTVFYIGYDERYRQEDQINSVLYTTSTLRRTNRAIFTKLQYLLRY
jgi:hypothetical protein